MTEKSPDTTAALEAALQRLDLTDVQRELLRIQWLNSLAFMDRHAQKNWRLHVVLRLIAIIGAVFVPAFVAISPPAEWARTIRIATFAMSLCVALATALESFFRSGDRWQHYRRNTEALRLEGMQYLMLSGPYGKFTTHQNAFPEFGARLNAILSTEVEAYFTQVAIEKPADEQHREASPKQERSGV